MRLTDHIGSRVVRADFGLSRVVILEPSSLPRVAGGDRRLTAHWRTQRYALNAVDSEE